VKLSRFFGEKIVEDANQLWDKGLHSFGLEENKKIYTREPCQCALINSPHKFGEKVPGVGGPKPSLV
jgi:hypothetical protein